MTSSTTKSRHHHLHNNHSNHHHRYDHDYNDDSDNDSQSIRKQEYDSIMNGWKSNTNNRQQQQQSPIMMKSLKLNKSKRGLSLDMDKMMFNDGDVSATIDDYLFVEQCKNSKTPSSTIYNNRKSKLFSMMMMKSTDDTNTDDLTTDNSLNNSTTASSNKLIDDYTVQYYRQSSAISNDQSVIIPSTTTATATASSKKSSKSNPNNHQLIKANSIGCDAFNSTTPTTATLNALVPFMSANKSLINDFDFTNDDLLNFGGKNSGNNSSNIINNNNDDINDNIQQLDNRSITTTTRATTPADEQIYQEPVESLQIRIGRLLSCEEMADMHFLVGSNSSQSSSTTSTLSSNASRTNNTQNIQNQNQTIGRKLRIPAHRLIMVSASPVFRQLLLNEQTGKFPTNEEIDDIEINDIEPLSFLEFLRFAYTDSAKLNKDNVIGIYVAAKRYEINTLEKQCKDFIQKCLQQKRSSLAIWIAARSYGLCELEKNAKKSIQFYAETVLLSQDFLRLDQQSLYEILSDDLLRADEIVIFRSLTRWAKQNCLRQNFCPNRTNIRMIIGNLLNLIRFPLMSEEQLQRIVAAEGILDDELLRALVHCSRNLPRTSNFVQTTSSLIDMFSNELRAFQRLNGRLLNVYRFQSFDNQLTNNYLNRSLNFLTNKRIWLAGIGLYSPRKACTFYLTVSIQIRRVDYNNQQWHSPLDHYEQTTVLKYDGNGHIINIKFDQPLQIDANVQYEILATITPNQRSTSLVRARLHPHLYYTRPNELNFYYGTEGQYATKVRINNRGENVIFNFNWERDSYYNINNNDDSNFTNDPNNPNNDTLILSNNNNNNQTNNIQSEPSTPNPPPRPPPPQEYRRPTRMQRLRRALSFVDSREKQQQESNSKTNNKAQQRASLARDSGLLEGQIPFLMFYA